MQKNDKKGRKAYSEHKEEKEGERGGGGGGKKEEKWRRVERGGEVRPRGRGEGKKSRRGFEEEGDKGFI